jgi:hypothetical protein
VQTSHIEGPRVLIGYRPGSMQTPEGRARHIELFCEAAGKIFQELGTVNRTSWIWAQQDLSGEDHPLILATELVGEAPHPIQDSRV